jgi:hypothetical protein
LKKNRGEIPKEFLPANSREVKSAVYGFTKDLTLVSFISKKNKAVLLTSSMHHDEQTDQQTGKPEIIEFYNGTKGRVNALDEKCRGRSRGLGQGRFGSMTKLLSQNISCVLDCLHWTHIQYQN